eukprot:CAMPEP_0172602622 /NCGR_PEP_ID=MMETSP1068-20121228/22805_1 /TAXON_ID=35684 /ORGANISM="Pseudopedinella elastica, Strain CCMP716" /LENGTH=273 /DNA_ID=CAMNT_0013404047 /DNA_START=32 /DNA_END=853 /DNA_ORIENTATION=-
MLYCSLLTLGLDNSQSISAISRRSVLSSPFKAATSAALFAPLAARAADPSRDYDHFSKTYDNLDGGPLAGALGLEDLRASVIGRARGKTLEVGVGTGLNLPFYRLGAVDGVEQLSGIDLSEGMLEECRGALAAGAFGLRTGTASKSTAPVTLKKMDVTALSFPDGSFDTVVDTFSLCVFPDPKAALQEMARVTKGRKEGGRVLLLEHSRAEGNDLLAAYQDLTSAPVASMGKGCVWNQQLGPLLASAGLEVISSKPALGGLLTVIEAAPKYRA